MDMQLVINHACMIYMVSVSPLARGGGYCNGLPHSLLLMQQPLVVAFYIIMNNWLTANITLQYTYDVDNEYNKDKLTMKYLAMSC